MKDFKNVFNQFLLLGENFIILCDTERHSMIILHESFLTLVSFHGLRLWLFHFTVPIGISAKRPKNIDIKKNELNG